ncbi:MAG: microviridin/marinostatin family tricyclic proteinase inhibitor [Acidobacteria bacterium]|nr:microviridin/marinostatin family tricyclic proteinase inhibitor [Acidobacteriota bacterium]
MQEKTGAPHNQEGDLPFFARYLEGQRDAGQETFATTKFPSDLDEAYTNKYPSDGDDNPPYPPDDDTYMQARGDEVTLNLLQTLKYPSDRDEDDLY